MSLSGPGGQTIRVLDHLKVPHPGVRHRPRTHPAKKKREALCCTPCHVKVPLYRAGSAFTGGAPLTPCESQGGAAVSSGRTPGGCACRICGAAKEEVEEGPVRDKRSTKDETQAVALGSCSKEGEYPASGTRKIGRNQEFCAPLPSTSIHSTNFLLWSCSTSLEGPAGKSLKDMQQAAATQHYECITRPCERRLSISY